MVGHFKLIFFIFAFSYRVSFQFQILRLKFSKQNFKNIKKSIFEMSTPTYLVILELASDGQVNFVQTGGMYTN